MITATSTVLTTSGTCMATELQTGRELLYANQGWLLKPVIIKNITTSKEPVVIIQVKSGNQIEVSFNALVPCEYAEEMPEKSMYFTYLMKRQNNYRIGVTQIYESECNKTRVGVKTRCTQEGGDCLWVLKACNSSDESRYYEILLSTQYGLPQIPFKARSTATNTGVVANQYLIDEIFEHVKTEERAIQLCKDLQIDMRYPHHWPKSTSRDIKNIKITLGGDCRGRSVLHRLAISLCDPKVEENIRSTYLADKIRDKKHKDNRRLETIIDLVSTDINKIKKAARTILAATPSIIVLEASAIKPLFLIPTCNIMKGMTIPVNGKFEIVTSVKKVQEPQNCINIEVAEGTGYIVNGFPVYQFDLNKD
jgi:hypothetical protein